MKKNWLHNILPAVLIIILALAVLPVTPVKAIGTTFHSTTTGGDWYLASTWVENAVPDPNNSDSIVIETTGGNAVTLTADTVIGGTLTINSGATLLTSGTHTLTFAAGDFVNNGVPFNAGSWNINIGSSLSPQNIAGFTTTGTVLMTKNLGKATFTGNVNAGGLSMTGTAILNLGSGLTHTFTGTWTRTAGTLEGNTSTLNLGGALSGIGGTFTANTGTVNYNGGAQTVAVVTYNNLTLSGSGVKTTTAGVTVNGILSMEGTATASAAPTYGVLATLQYNRSSLQVAGLEWITPFAAAGGVIIANTGTITMNGAKIFNPNIPLTINSGATLATGAGLSLTLGGNFTKSGTLTAGASPIVITGTATAQSIAGFTTTGLVTMSKIAGIATFTSPVSGGALTINGAGGTLDLGTGLTHTFSGILSLTAGTLDGNSSTLNLNGGANVPTAGIFTANTGTVNYGGGTVPVAGLTYNNLSTNGTLIKTTNGNVTVLGNLTVGSGSNFTVGSAVLAHTLNVTGNTSISGTLTFLSTGAKTFTGNVTINNGGTLTDTGVAAINFAGNLQNDGTYTVTTNTGVHTFSGTAKTISGANAITIPSVSVTGTITNSGTLTVSTTLAGAGTLTQGTTGTLNINGTETITNLIATAIGNTVNYTGGAQTVKDISYHHLGLSGSGVKTLPAGLTAIGGNLSLSGTATATTVAAMDIGGNLTIHGSGALNTIASLTVSGFDFTVHGTTTIDATTSPVANGKLIFSSASGAKTFVGMVTVGANGTWDNTINVPIDFNGGLAFSGKTFTAGTGAYTFKTTVTTQTIGGTVAFTIPNLAVDSGVNLTNNNSGGLTVSATLSGLGTLTQGGTGVLNINTTTANFTLSNFVASASGNTVNYNLAGAQNVRAIPYHNLTLSTSGSKDLASLTTITGALTLSGAVTATTDPDPGSATPANFTVGGNMTIGAGTTLTVGGDNITVTGATSVAGTLAQGATAGTKLYTGLVTVTGIWNNGGEDINFRGGLTSTGTFTAGTGLYTFETIAAQTIDGTISIPNLVVASGVTLTNDGTITVVTVLSGTGTWAQGTTGILNISGTPPTITTLIASAVGNTVNYNGAAQAVRNISYHHLTLSGTLAKTLPVGLPIIAGNLTIGGTTTVTLVENLTIGGNLTTVGTQLDASTRTINVGGNWSGPFAAGTSTVTLNGAATQTISGAPAFHNLTINKPSLGVTIAASTAPTVNGTLNLTSGKITTGALVSGSYNGTLIIGNSGSVTGASELSYVVGNLRKLFPVSVGIPQSFTFAIGDAATYAPVDLTIASVTSNTSNTGYITAKTTPAEHPNIGTVTGFSASQDVNRYWTLTPAAITFTTYDANFNFGSTVALLGGLDVGADPTTFIAKRYQTTTVGTSLLGWKDTTTGTQTTTSTQATGIPWTSVTNVYSYAVGEPDTAPSVIDINSSTSDGYYNVGDVISGITVTFSELVNVTGFPQLTLETGAADKILNYMTGTGTDTLTFADYTVQAGDTSPDLNATLLSLNGGTIKDNILNPAVLTITGTPLATNKAIVIDTTAPDTTIDSNPASTDTDNTPTFTFSINDGAGSGLDYFMCKMDAGAYAACTSPFTSSALINGSHTFSVYSTDLAGNVDATPDSYTWTIHAPPSVLSIVRVSPLPDPTSALSVGFTVTFSESVIGVDMIGPPFDDFGLFTSGVAGAAITGVSGSGSVYTVTVNTGSGSGTIRLDVPVTATITDTTSIIPIIVPFTTGETYTISKNNVDVYIGGGVPRGSYLLATGQSTRQNYTGVDSGPVQVVSTGGAPIIAAIRDAWAVSGVTTSFSQLMGLPLEQLSDQYVFPGYNNVTLNDQLRIANVDPLLQSTTVIVTIGGVERGTYPLAAGAAVRINYAGLDSGPVVVQGTSGVKIISAIREAWSVNGVIKSFVQLMGLPAGQLSNKYVFPAYNNVTLNEQLRIGNVDPTQSTVATVTIGGILRGIYPLGPGEAVRVNYAGLDSGPVIVEGTVGVPIISSIRSAWSVNGVITSFAQLMGMPAGQLSNKYLFPAYNNLTVNDQLRIANVDPLLQSSTVTVTIGGVARGTYPLAAGGAVRINYAGLDSGPVVVEGTPSTVKIISAIREAWSVNGAIQSFVQLMGLPAGQLSTTYLFPAYNNVTLSEQLRFGVP